MKKFISIFLIVTVILSCVFVLTACNPANKIVGEWRYTGYDFSHKDTYDWWIDLDFHGKMVFNKDGTGFDCNNDTFVWKYDKATKNFIIAEETSDFGTENEFSAFIDKDNILHMDYYTYKKAK